MPKNQESPKDPVEHLKKADPILSSVIVRLPRPKWKHQAEYFRSLVESIINQQLSDKAADTIIGRFNLLFKNSPYTPEQVLKLDKEKIRGVGISYAKIAYIKDLAKKVQDQELSFDSIHLLDDEEIISYLTQVKGIGRWTAEMFLMFSLGREDVFSYGDLGLKNAIKKLYKLKSHPTEKQAIRISSKWRPYRTWACRYLWASLEL